MSLHTVVNALLQSPQLGRSQNPALIANNQNGLTPPLSSSSPMHTTNNNGQIGLSTANGRPQPAAGSLVASINCNKIRGHVTLTPNTNGQGTTVSTQITSGPVGEVYLWSIHQFPVKPGAAMCSCSPLILGG